MQNLVVIGGNGLVGSAVCKAAVSRGWKVTSISSSGKPFETRAGHQPAWAGKVTWRPADALDPSTYSTLLPEATAVVSTLGILLEGQYKKNKAVSPLSFLSALRQTLPGGRNPLEDRGGRTYERLNRDAAVTIFRALAESTSPPSGARRPFVFVSAEDIFRPVVPARYIETKREAEVIIAAESASQGSVRPVFVRPSLIYDPHLAPAVTLPATALDLSSTLLAHFPGLTAASLPPSSIASSLRNLLTIKPVHVDLVGNSVCEAIADEGIEGVLDVRGMRELQESLRQRTAAAA